ncbi:MAG: DUF932 domain-containing protein [Bacteroidetes bacterium]|nr:DUF932 domain-containing protein [Bacteroidota bacterium]
MSDLVLHRGAQQVEKDALDLVQLPDQTDSYVPVSHYELANSLTTIGQDILTDYALIGENYALARQGQQLFAVLKFKKDNADMALSVGFRNSYDRSMSIGICMGATVFVCDNLALSGDIAVMKKHTKNVWASLEDLAIASLYRASKTFDQIINDSEAFKARQFNDDDAFKTLGLFFGKGILSPRQLPVIKDKWLKPPHQEFQPRNAWSFYNSCTDAMKNVAPLQIMEKHVNLHNEMTAIAAQPF